MKLKEWHRTVVLLILIIVAIGYIVWLRTGYQSNLLEILR
jgi:hypothetical protein